MKRALTLPAALLLSLSALAACGSDDDMSGADTTEAAGAASDDSTEETTEETVEESTADTDAPEDSTADTATAETTDVGDTAAPGGDGETCDALREISEYDKISNEILAGGGDIEDIKQLFEESTPDVLAAYDRVAAAEPELADETATLSEFTAAAAEASQDTDSLGGLVTAILGLPGVMEAGAAGVSLNSYAEENCGFSTGNQASGEG